MKTRYATILLTTTAVAVITVAATFSPARADETEIFTGVPDIASGARPNILFIIDTSGSMAGEITTQEPYDPSETYSGDCSSNRVYFRSGSDAPPDCGGAWVPASSFYCDAARDPLDTVGYYLADRAARWDSSSRTSSKRKWRSLKSGSSNYVECRADAGIHGNGTDTTRLWAADGSNGPWTSSSGQQISWNANDITNYTFFSANYLNWYHGDRITIRTRLQIVQEVATQTIDQLAAADKVNVGLMRYSHNTTDGCSSDSPAQGGMVVVAMDEVGNNADAMKAAIAAFNAGGCTPLTESLFEAYRYLSGGPVTFGLTSRTAPGTLFPSVTDSRLPAPDAGTYASPLTGSCERNFIVLLTDGLPTADNAADASIVGLTGAACVDQMAGQSWSGKGSLENDGQCLDEIARYMYENDLRSATAGNQNVTTYAIGFGPEVAQGTALLQTTASSGGGKYYTAGDTAELTVVLTDIIRNILSINTTFTAPAVSVNAFNRTQNLNDLYVTVFRPSESYFWPGNIKKYRLAADGTIMDATGDPAVDITTGFFRTTAQSFWTAGIDGDDVALGGASNELPVPADRKVYTNTGTDEDLTAEENQVTVANAAINAALLGLNTGDPPGRDALIEWLRGADVADTDGDSDVSEARRQMGDPMHGRPATVIYGGTTTAPDLDDGVIFAVTNEGYLHAVDVNDGAELWAYMPRDLLGRAAALYEDDAISERVWGLDGNVRLFKYDVNEDGIVDADDGDRVLLFIGMRRGGSDYYGLDVTDREVPELLWKIGPNESGSQQLPGAGQSWSTPAVARVDVGGATQNEQKLVLIFGGGYDTVQDNGPYATDSQGNRVFMVDALSGSLLWYAGDGSDADLQLAAMTHSIPADVRVVDITGDGFVDRIYTGDMGGRIWRFDIFNGNDPDDLVTGRVFASLGNAHLGSHPAATTRRFYGSPDVAFLSSGGQNWVNLAIGSGYRGHPLDLGTQDRFYSLRDYAPFTRLTQAEHNAIGAITEADTGLIDVSSDINTTIPTGAKGWRFDLKASGSWSGEKSLAEARTFQNVVQFSTYEPNVDETFSSSSCSPAVGTNRLYAVSAFTGAPVKMKNRDNPAEPPDSPDSPEDRYEQLVQGGIAPEVVWLFPSPDNPESCVGAECHPPPVCLVGVETCGTGTNVTPVRTYWRQSGVN